MPAALFVVFQAALLDTQDDDSHRSRACQQGLEMGFYQDPYSDFGRLTTEMMRAVRLVVDTGNNTLSPLATDITMIDPIRWHWLIDVA